MQCDSLEVDYAYPMFYLIGHGTRRWVGNGPANSHGGVSNGWALCRFASDVANMGFGGRLSAVSDVFWMFRAFRRNRSPDGRCNACMHWTFQVVYCAMVPFVW